MADAVAIQKPKGPAVSYAEPIAEQKKFAAAAAGNLEGAIANLLQLEKTARLSGDSGGTTELCVAMVDMCHAAKDYPRLNETITMLSKRRAQVKEAVGAMVRKATEFLDGLPDEATTLALIDTLRAVSEGKMFVEVERARLTKRLAGMHEASGKTVEARKIMIQTVVETLGGMDKREKTSFILEQVRLCLDTDEYVRAQIMARKINVKVFKDEEIADLKLSYYGLIVRYHLHEENWMEIFRAYQAMWSTPSLQADDVQRADNLKRQCIYLMLAAFDKDRTEQLHILGGIAQLAELPMYKELVRLFTTQEIFHFTELSEPLKAELTALGGDFPTSKADKMLEVFHKRVTEHNLNVISSYYTRITLERLAALLELEIGAMESQLCGMVSAKQIYARIDRPAGVVSFEQPRTPNSLLNDWAGDISTLLTKLEGTCHLIHKENMVHKIA